MLNGIAKGGSDITTGGTIFALCDVNLCNNMTSMSVKFKEFVTVKL